MIETYGYQPAFLWFGIGQGVIILLLAPFLKAPLPGQIKASTKKSVTQSARNFTPGEDAAHPAVLGALCRCSRWSPRAA